MKIGVIGTGYVGLVTGVCLSDVGNDVTCYDIDEDKINSLNNGDVSIYEPGLKHKLETNLKNDTINFSSDLGSICDKNSVLFIAVGTPPNEDGSSDLKHIYSVADNIGKNIKNDILVVVKSTVPVGTSLEIKRIILAKNSNAKLSIVNNPEFLREGRAVEDFMKPDRIILGVENEEVFLQMKKIYRPFSLNTDRIIKMDIPSSEMTKYASNAMLACRISFMNEISQICERVGANVNDVRNGMGADERIGYKYLYPSVGYGGSCFPKDLKALSKISKDYDYDSKIINATMEVNTNQIASFAERIKSYIHKIDNPQRKVSIWGVSFKPETDDVRDAPSLHIIDELLNLGIDISVYDPKGMNNFRSIFKNKKINFSKNKYESIENSDCLILLTEWQEFRSPDFKKIKEIMRKTVIFDGRNIYNKSELNQLGFEYFQIGVKD